MNRADLIEVFQDTMEWCKTEELQSAIAHSIKATKLYSPQEYPTITAEKKNAKIIVTKSKTFEAAQRIHIHYPNKRLPSMSVGSFRCANAASQKRIKI